MGWGAKGLLSKPLAVDTRTDGSSRSTADTVTDGDNVGDLTVKDDPELVDAGIFQTVEVNMDQTTMSASAVRAHQHRFITPRQYPLDRAPKNWARYKPDGKDPLNEKFAAPHR